MKDQKRQKQLSWLVGLSALSAVALYIIQGALATGADVKTFPAWFWVADYVLWGFRALIEAAVIVYLFSTETQTKAQARALGVLEFLLIALITLTIGPALRAVGLGQPMAETVAPEVLTAWSFGIAAYTSLMVGAAGYAYRVQKADTDDALGVDVAQLEREYADAKNRIKQLTDTLADAGRFHEQDLAAAVKTSALLEALGAKDRAKLYLLAQNGDGADLTVAGIAERLRMSDGTVRNARKELRGES